MQHEKIIKRPDGSSVKIYVSLTFTMSGHYGQPYYVVAVFLKAPKKKKWEAVRDTDDFTWRRLDINGRREYDMKKSLEHVSAEEILEVKRELWKLLEPTK
jgi:hypothetical protein